MAASTFSFSNGVALAATVSQVKDITAGSGSSSLANFTNVNGTMFFSRDDTELWKSDGSDAGTTLLKTFTKTSTYVVITFIITPGLSNLTNVNGTLFFQAKGDANGYELWKSDGTVAGTVRVSDINPGAGSSDPYALVDVNGTLFFAAVDTTNGAELWKSDGTTAGTTLVADINPGSGYSAPQNLTNVNGTLFFRASDGSSGVELWKSDGTTAGTTLVKDILAGSNSSYPENLTDVNGRLFFQTNDATSGIELWTSDGTAAGTTLVKDIVVGSGSSSPQNLTNVNGRLFFTANDGTSGSELWTSDGTAAGTVIVKDINSVTGGSFPASLTNVNGTLFFRANDGSSGTELWTSDGTDAGTMRVADINPGSGSSSPQNLTNVNGTLFFQASDGTSGYELWTSDGSTTGTLRVADINPNTGSSSPSYLTNVNGTLFFMANDGSSGTELWKASPSPTLALSGNKEPISNGASTTSTANGTDFGSSAVGQTVSRTFTIANTGAATLTLGNISVVEQSSNNAAQTTGRMSRGAPISTDFSLTSLPAASVAPGESTTFQVTFTPSAAGIRSATVSIASNDSSANPFNFAIQGNGVAAQTITFGPLAAKSIDDVPFSVSATASSGLAVTFSSATSAVCTFSGNSVTLVAAGTCTISADQAGDATYGAAPQVQQSFIVKGNQTISFGTLTGKTYGDAAFTVSATAESGLAVTFGGSTPAVCTVAAGQAGNSNYNAAPAVSQSLTVAKKTLTARAQDKIRKVGTANPAFTLVYSGFAPGDDASTLSSAPIATTTANPASPLGNYDITVSGGNAANYSFSYEKGTLTVTDKDIPLLSSTPATLTYGTALSAAQLGSTATMNGLPVAGTFNYSPAPGTVLNAGSYIITVAFTPTDSAAYESVTGQVQVIVERAPLTITADNKSIVAGAALPTFTARYTGLVNGDTAASLDTAVTLMTTATASSTAGSYAITASGAADANYQISFVAGTLNIRANQNFSFFLPFTVG